MTKKDMDVIVGELKITFDPNHPGHKKDLKNFLNSTDWYLVAWNLDQELRSRVKYSTDEISDDTLKAYEEVRDMIYKLLEEYGLSFEDHM